MAKNPRLIDLTGLSFGSWSVIHQAGNTKGGGALWLSRCKCGNQRSVLGADLRAGKSVSCGCEGSRATMGKRSTTHGKTGTRIYTIFKGMHARCSHPRWVNHYGKGITVCDEWSSFEAFHAWAMEHGYADHLTIERVDNSKEYSPNNCIWADMKVQARNRSIVRRAPDGRAWAEIAEEHGISARMFNNRLHAGGWDAETAATWPKGKRRTQRERLENGQWAPQASTWRR